MKEVIIEPVRSLHFDGYEDERFVALIAGVFWAFNGLYLLCFSVIAGPMLIQQLWPAIELGDAPMHQLAVLITAMLLPIVAVSLVFLGDFERDKTRLSAFFFGVELPIAAIFVGRSFWANELNTTSFLLYGFMLAVAACQGVLLWRRKVSDLPLTPSGLPRTAASAVVMIGGAYLSALMLIFSLPFTLGAIALGIGGAVMSVISIVYMPPLLLGIIPAAILVVLGWYALRISFYLPYCYVSQFTQHMKTVDSKSHQSVAVLVAVLCLLGFMALQYKTTTDVFPMIEHAQDNHDARAELLARSEHVRHELVDNYLAPLRYLPDDFGLGVHHPLFTLWNATLTFLLPTLRYDGNAYADAMKAERYYESFFDESIQRAERKAIVASHRNQWSITGDPSAGLLSIGQRTVHVESQTVTASAQNGVATVTIQEVLRNKTNRQLETYQYFTLPESAVITGLWLSNVEDNPQLYEFQIAPRGAAQQVYKEQVQIRVDPALLELVGPRQYRLRVFPVLPVEPMVVTMTYKTLSDADGRWALPRLQEQRNIFWNKDTVRTVNGAELRLESESHWLPAHIPLADESMATMGYRDGSSYYYAKPLPEPALALKHKKIAVLIDGSYSMGHYRSQLPEALELTDGMDLYFCQIKCSATNSASLAQWQFYGDSQPLQHIRAFRKKIAAYDAVVLLSDGGNYETEKKLSALQSDVPFWLVEFGNSANAYADEVIDTIRQSGGDLVFSMQQALLQLSVYGELNPPLAITSSHVWRKRPLSDGDVHNENLAEILAALRVKRLSQSEQSLESLDSLHEIAIKHGVVTPYSSFIVLVNDRQRERLEELSNRSDRFARETETGKQRLPRRRVANAVPEPHEYALMLIALFLLIVTARRQGWTVQRFIQFNSPAW